MVYDETDAIRYIRSKTGERLTEYDDDQILNIIDIVWDWQEANGFLDIDADDTDDDIDPAAIASHALNLLRKDKGNLVKPEDVLPIIEAELEFENTFDQF